MPIVPWGLGAETIDDFDRSKIYEPYKGKTPPNAVYQWRIKRLKVAAVPTKKKNGSIHIGLELVPRDSDEKEFAGYYITKFLTPTPNNAFTYVPFCDAIGITGTEFDEKMKVDEEGNVKKIGKWANDGKTIILGALIDGTDQNDEPRKEIGWVGPADTDNDDEDDDDDDEEETPKAKSKKLKKGKKKRRPADEDDDEAF